ncbi:glycosyltransferase family 4 protein [Puia sp. P3]|uniref:glycosyltransferase family 4 protein n=1 Tax=Puia sp. P3 TaxID=3423952 RepID=UPI003D679D7D
MERIFMQLSPLIARRMKVISWSAPYSKFAPAELFRNIRAAGKNRADIYHVTGDIHYVVMGLPRRRTVLTIHDCVFLYQASGLKRKLLKWILLDMPVRRSSLVTTISEATKKDILNFSDCPPEKVVVIPDPVSDSIYYRPAEFGQNKPVLLFVGTTENKNLLRVAAALEGLSCRLDIVGRLSAEQEQALSTHRIEYTAKAGLSDEEIADKYAQSDIVLFPSTFEGFGLPIVEGQKAGRPVITSDLDPMRETAGKGACLVDPYDTASIRQGVIRVIEDKAYREMLVQDGLANVQRFSAERVASQYLACYEQLLNS